MDLSLRDHIEALGKWCVSFRNGHVNYDPCLPNSSSESGSGRKSGSFFARSPSAWGRGSMAATSCLPSGIGGREIQLRTNFLLRGDSLLIRYICGSSWALFLRFSPSSSKRVSPKRSKRVFNTRVSALTRHRVISRYRTPLFPKHRQNANSS